MGKRKTKEEFKTLLSLINPNIKLLEDYIDSKTKIKCECLKCGNIWEVISSNLLRGRGCPKCANIARGKGRKLDTKTVLEKMKEVHGDKYDYSKFIYTKSIEKSIITCRIHGDFLQTPHMHLQGNGCPKCNGGIKYTTSDFINKAREIHGDIYDYSKVNYIKNTIPVDIYCKIHGIFKLTPMDHIAGCKCPKCSMEHGHFLQSKTLDEFISQSKEIHGNKYDYSKTKYINGKTKVCIICPEHGEFWQTPTNHIGNKQGCPICRASHGEQSIFNYLTNNNIKFIPQYEIPIDTTINKSGIANIDFYLPDYNIFIEYNGILHYVPMEYFGGKLKFDNYLTPRDNYIKEYCSINNINLIVISYQDDILQKLRGTFENL